jgi:CubicO group peptidase (beta-lactamase class C family)
MDSNIEVSPTEAGLDADAMRRAHLALEELSATGKYPALQVCVRHRGKIVLHRALGEFRPMDDGPTREATVDTRFLLFSVSKCVIAMAMHILFDRDQVNVDDPVHWYIPEFGRHGKRHITLRHILTHSAGIPMIFWHLDDALISDWDGIIEDICAQTPHHFPGRRTSYHILSGGYILAEVIQRVDGRDIRTFLEEEIRGPCGMETFTFGLDREHWSNAAKVERVDELPPSVFTNAISRLIDVDVVEALAVINRDVVWESAIPAGNVVGTAEETSRFFQMLLDGGVCGENRILSEAQVTRATGEQVMSRVDWTLFLTPQRYSLGFMLGRKRTPFNIFGRNSERTFGHIGFTREFGWADPERDMSVGFLTSGVPIRPGAEVLLLRRFQNALKDAC